MWLQNLLLLGTVVCSISAPTHPASPVTLPKKIVDVTNEALELLKHSDDTAVNETVEVVLQMSDAPELACLQKRLELFKKGLRGNLTTIKGLLTTIGQIYKENCSLPETSCATQVITFKNFKTVLQEFLTDMPFHC